MLPAAILCDFDGTIVPEDVSEQLLETHGDPSWLDIDLAYQRGEIGSRECAIRQVALLPAAHDRLVNDALSRFAVDPSFSPFVQWCRTAGIHVGVVSDGFGFYVEEMLNAAGISGLEIVTNLTSFESDGPRLSFPNGHPACAGCGTCKMNAVLSARERSGRPVAFVGEGHTDQYAAVYADLVFASKHLAGICDRGGIPYVAWHTFADVHAFFESGLAWPAGKPAPPELCPGWFPKET